MENEKEIYINWLKDELGYRPDTIKHYTYYYDKFGGTTNLNEGYIRSFLVNQFKNNGVARAFVRSYMEFVESYADEIPGVDISKLRLIKFPRSKKKEKKLPLFISENQLQMTKQKMRSDRDVTLLLLSYFSGLRLQEVLGLSPNHFIWEGWNKNPKAPGMIKITSDIAKGGKERYVYLPPLIMQKVKDYIEFAVAQGIISSIADPLFGIGERRWQKILEVASRKALGFSISPHTLRHSYATMLRRKGVPLDHIKELLGHTSIATTQIYSHIGQKQVFDAYSQATSSLMDEGLI